MRSAHIHRHTPEAGQPTVGPQQLFCMTTSWSHRNRRGLIQRRLTLEIHRTNCTPRRAFVGNRRMGVRCVNGDVRRRLGLCTGTPATRRRNGRRTPLVQAVASGSVGELARPAVRVATTAGATRHRLRRLLWRGQLVRATRRHVIVVVKGFDGAAARDRDINVRRPSVGAIVASTKAAGVG